MYYLKNEYPNNVIIFNPDNSILCRFMHYDYKTENEALNQAQKLIDMLNEKI